MPEFLADEGGHLAGDDLALPSLASLAVLVKSLVGRADDQISYSARARQIPEVVAAAYRAIKDENHAGRTKARPALR